MTEIYDVLIRQRIRNRIIDYLELASSFEDQLAYDRAGSPACVPNEVINQWEDWVERSTISRLGPPVFSAEERAALLAYDIVWDHVAELTPDPLPPLRELMRTELWNTLRKAAGGALAVMNRRGRFSEERAEFG